MTNAKQQLTIADSFKNAMPEFSQLLKATGTDPDKFKNNALMAIAEKPEIAQGQVSAKSVFNVCSRAANDGVVLDGKEAAMVIGSVKVNGEWTKQAQYRLMAGGAMKIISRSPNIERVVCQLIYENDDFVVDFVTSEAAVKHQIKPKDLKKGRGEVVGVYFTAKLVNGEWTSPEVMSVDEVNEVRDGYVKRNSSGQFSGMWEKSWGEAARKTVLHRARKRLPLEGNLATSLAYDDEEALIVDAETGEIIEDTPQIEEQPKKTAPAKKKSAKESVKKAAAKATEVKEEPAEAAHTEENPPPYDDSDIQDAEFEEVEEDEGEEIPV